MKKSCLLMMMLIITAIAFSQHKKVRFGIQSGINLSNINSKIGYSNEGVSYTTKLPFKSLAGFTGGIHAEIRLFKNIYLQPELSYSQLGAKYTYTNTDTTVPASQLTPKSILHYLILPVLVKYKIAHTGAAVFAGPQYGYLLSETNKIENTTINEKDKSSYKSDVAAIFGAEYYSPFGLGISARYQLGIANILKPEYIDVSNFPQNISLRSISVRNNAFTLTLGYRF